MAELTQEQIKQASEAFRAAHGGSSGLLAAAPFLQLPWDEPTELDIVSAAGALHRAGRVSDALIEFVRRHNAALQPKPVDPRREKILDVMHTLSCIRDGEVTNARLSAKACWDVLNTVLDAAK